MYNDEWRPVMEADSMEEQVAAMAALARKQAENRDRDVEDVVCNMTHESYLLKHTTGDVLRELAELEGAYPDAFYDGAANDHIMKHYADMGERKIEFWHEYAYTALAAGLEWAILNELKTASQSPR